MFSDPVCAGAPATTTLVVACLWCLALAGACGVTTAPEPVLDGELVTAAAVVPDPADSAAALAPKLNA